MIAEFFAEIITIVTQAEAILVFVLAAVLELLQTLGFG